MFKSRSAILVLWAATLALAVSGCVTAVAAQEAAPLSESSGLRVTLSANRSTTSWDAREPDARKFELPLLFLHRQRETAPEAERTLSIQLAGLESAIEIRLEAVSRHVDASTGAPHVESTGFISTDRACTLQDPCTVRWTFGATAPSDLYKLHVKDGAGQTLWSNAYADRPDFVALDAWDVELGAYTARVYYATLFPFARGQNDLDNRLPPDRVPDFIAGQFLPIIVDTWQTQFVEWGFGASVHPDWDTDNLVEIVITDPPFALFDGTGTYTRFTGDDGLPYQERRIWWFANNNAFQAYDTLENGYKAVFAHEFFHTMQWNVLLSVGEASAGEASAGEASAARPTNLWKSWIEAQGRFASAVQYPELELAHEHLVLENSAYLSGANRFLAHHLNTSYGELEGDEGNKYDAALYWRFLYEQYGDMGIIRAALEEMVHHYGADTVSAMRRAMGAAFARVDGPYQSFEESLVAFARANYALRLEHGRCVSADLTTCEGLFYDPAQAYADPPAEAELDYVGAPLHYSGAIPASYGMDFIELRLEYGRYDQPLRISFEGQGDVVQFHVQLWMLGPGRARPQAVTPRPEVVSPAADGDGAYSYVIPPLDWIKTNRLALIITRIDPDEAADMNGDYQITLEPTT